MLCQMCLQAEATVHMVDRTPGELVVESDYCRACYDLQYVNPPAHPPDFPRPRFTIRRLMIIAVVFAILNAAVTLFMRSGLVTGTPAQIHEWTLQAFLFANLTCGLMTVSFLSLGWLQKVEWHRRTGGLVPMPQPQKLGPGERSRLIIAIPIVMVPLAGWIIAVCLFLNWLTPLLWPGRRPHILLIWAVVVVPFLIGPLVLAAPDRRHELVRAIRAGWRRTSLRERFVRTLFALYPFIIVLVLSNPRCAA